MQFFVRNFSGMPRITLLTICTVITATFLLPYNVLITLMNIMDENMKSVLHILLVDAKNEHSQE